MSVYGSGDDKVDSIRIKMAPLVGLKLRVNQQEARDYFRNAGIEVITLLFIDEITQLVEQELNYLANEFAKSIKVYNVRRAIIIAHVIVAINGELLKLVARIV